MKKRKRIYSVAIFSVFLLIGTMLAAAPSSAAASIDNSSLLPAYKDHKDVKLEGSTPDWVKSLIITNFRIETVSDEGTFRGAVKALNHVAETGSNGIWISPIFEVTATEKKRTFPVSTDKGNIVVENGFQLKEVDKVNPRMGTLSDFKYLVNEAHKRNIRVFLDVVPHGVAIDNPIVQEHPEWFIKNQDGELALSWTYAYDFDFNVPEAREWYIEKIVNFVVDTNVDGLRLDIEPLITIKPELVWEKVKSRCLEKGKKIVLFPEHMADVRGTAYDFEQIGVYLGQGVESNKAFMKYKIVSQVKNGSWLGGGGKFRYYTMQLSSHDAVDYASQGGSTLISGYQALLAPYIPVYYIGEEFNNSRKGTLYFNWINYSFKEKNRDYYEKFKKMIQIRRKNAAIFEYFPEDHRESNIEEVVITNEKLQAYVRYAGNRAVMVIPNSDNASKKIKVTIPFEKIGFKASNQYTLTDLMTDKVLKTGTGTQLDQFEVQVDKQGVAVIALDLKSSPGTGVSSSKASGTQSTGAGVESKVESGGAASGVESGVESGESSETGNASSEASPASDSRAEGSSAVPGGTSETSAGKWIVIIVAAAVLVGGGVAGVLLWLKKRRSLSEG